MASQTLPTSTTNGSVHENQAAPSSPSHSQLPSLAASTAAFLKSQAPPSVPSSSPKAAQSLPPIIQPPQAKLPNLTPQTLLTGSAALASKRSGQPVKKMSDESKPKPEQADKPDTSTTPNPAMVLQGFPSMSRPSDAPSQETSSVSQKLSGLPSIATAANAMDTSGSSPSTATTTASAATEGSGTESGANTATAGPNNTDPALLQPQDPSHQYQHIAAQQPQRANSISEQLSATTPTTPGFGPNASTPTTPYSPNATTPGGRGKHTCPHCHQNFTRHHNLKSHLLTHSHEKPFLCQTCQARFRRLHDLKRHSKLHTGERPHVCTKCGRKFARGDALARHARAEGGCAGRRSSMAGMMEDGSMGSMGSGDGDDGMEGLEGLIGDADGDVDMLGGEESARRRSLPTIRTDFSHGAQNSQGQITPASSGYSHVQGTHHHPTYPPINTPNRTASTAGPSPASGSGLFPPQNFLKGNASTSTSPLQASALSASSSVTPTSGGGGNILSGVITDSPRASSPAIAQGRQDSASQDRSNSLDNALVAALQQPREGAPTAQMSGGQPNNIFAAGNVDSLLSVIRSLEERIQSVSTQNQHRDAKIQSLENTVRLQAEEIRGLKNELAEVRRGQPQKQAESSQQGSQSITPTPANPQPL